MTKRFDVPGRATGSYVIPAMESVTAERILDVICVAVSVRRILDGISGEDFDIFEVGSRRESILLEGAVLREDVRREKWDSTGNVLLMRTGRGKGGEEGAKVRLKISAKSRQSSRCCV